MLTIYCSIAAGLFGFLIGEWVGIIRSDDIYKSFVDYQREDLKKMTERLFRERG
jgi:hypothetical protein